MKTLTIRDFRTRPKAVRKTIAQAGEALLTVNGRPVALLVSVEDGLEEAVALVTQVRAQRAAGALRRAARESGVDRLTAREIAEVVARARRERRKRRPA